MKDESIDKTAPSSDEIVLPTSVVRRMHHKQQRNQRAFLKGPVPMAWLRKAMEIPGHGLAVAIVLRFYYGLLREPEVIPLTYAKILKETTGCKRTIQRGLNDLEDAGLVTVTRTPGRKMEIRLREITP